SKINSLYEKIDKLENADLERLKFLKELHKNVSGGPNTLIRFGIFKLFITYFLPLVPVLPMLITYFLKQ
ncbi:MAG: hypothetical protein U9O90_00135, partial [Euryarchaeota archaeon]|nr:hypothetical protein [Euryarchaeota archaeon]